MANVPVETRVMAANVTIDVVAMPQPARRRNRPGSPIQPVIDPLRWKRPPLPQLPPRPEPDDEPDQQPVPQPTRPAPTPLRSRMQAA